MPDVQLYPLALRWILEVVECVSFFIFKDKISMIPVIFPRDLLLKIIKFWIGKQKDTRSLYFSPLTNKFSSPPPF